MQSGLDLALSVRVAYADLALAVDRQALANEAAATLQRIDTLTQSRLAAGDIAELDARAARVDAVRSAQDAERAVHDVTIARERLRLLLGLPADDASLNTLESSGAVERCGSVRRSPEARARRPAGSAGGGARGRSRGGAVGMGAVANSGAHRRARRQRRKAQKASRAVQASTLAFRSSTATRAGGSAPSPSCSGRRPSTCSCSSRSASTSARRRRCSSRRGSPGWPGQTGSWRRCGANLTDAEESYAAGESSYLFVLENSRRLIEARVREREIAADERRAQARIERAAGMGCHAVSGGTQ